jgi:putative hemolysin
VTLFLELVAVAALILLNGFFVAAEYALVTARRTRIAELEQQGSRRARAVKAIVAEPPRFIAAMQLGVTLTSLGIGAVGEPVLTHAFDPALATLLAIILAFVIITFFHVVIGELVPKGLALKHAERIALGVSAPVRGFFVLFHPIVWILQRSTEIVLRWLRTEPPGAEEGVLSEAEIRMLAERSAEYGEIEPEEQEMLYKVFDFADKEVTDVMVPRSDVVAISIDLEPDEALRVAIESPYTRYPVYRGSLDEVVGILHVRDLFQALQRNGDIKRLRLEDLVRDPHIVPETKDVAALLQEFRKTKEHMAIVMNEHGTMEGIVTLEDLLEELVGEIEDEFDLPDESVERIDENVIRIDGTFPIDDFNEQFATELPVEDYHTMAGFVFGLLGRAPEPGDEVQHDGTRFRVIQTDGSRIERLQVEFVPAESEAAAPDQAE